jgi:hypothetical protein
MGMQLIPYADCRFADRLSRALMELWQVRTRSYPFSANRSAAALPIPRDAPVIRAHFLLLSVFMAILPFCFGVACIRFPFYQVWVSFSIIIYCPRVRNSEKVELLRIRYLIDSASLDRYDYL